MTEHLDRYAIAARLLSLGAPLRAGAHIGDGMAAALWERDAVDQTRYVDPDHHTLSLYVDGGRGFGRRIGNTLVRNDGPGSLCLMPAHVSTEWHVTGAVRLFHLYIERRAFDRAVAEALEADPAAVALRDETYVRDPVIETLIRNAILPLDWCEPADRLAVSHASQAVLAYVVSRFTERGADAFRARGGLAPAVLRRVREFIDAHLGEPLAIEDLAEIAGLSPFHFARAFKRSTGQSPHQFVLRQRIERAKRLLAEEKISQAEVALLCGFSSQSHFTARFRSLVGVTPGEFTRRA